MTFRPAYDIPLSCGGNTVWLRPSLLAATRLEALHNGFPALLIKIQEIDTATLRNIITYSATDRSDAQALLTALKDRPLHILQQTILGPVLALVSALMQPVSDDEQPTNNTSTDKPIEWAVFYADLFKMATGWLGWPPATAWNATMPEIIHAFEGHTDQLKAIHGGNDDVDETDLSPEQQQANVEAGLDPEFDRAGLQSLSGMGAL